LVVSSTLLQTENEVVEVVIVVENPFHFGLRFIDP